MTSRLLVLSVLLVAGAPVQAESPGRSAAPMPAEVAAAANLAGRVEHGRYFAPGDVYSVPVPVLHGEGSIVMDNGEIVVFKDKVSTLLTIAAFPMPAIAKWEHDTTPAKDYLIAFFRDNILRDYLGEFPETTIENARYLPDFPGGAMIAFTLLPGGSAFAPADPPPPTAPPPIAKRGHFVFVRDDRVFVVAIELAERVVRGGGYALAPANEDQLLVDRLAAVVSAMHFRPEENEPKD